MNKKYIISAESAEEIKEYRKGVTDKYLDRRMHAVQLLGEGNDTRMLALAIRGLQIEQEN